MFSKVFIHATTAPMGGQNESTSRRDATAGFVGDAVKLTLTVTVLLVPAVRTPGPAMTVVMSSCAARHWLPSHLGISPDAALVPKSLSVSESAALAANASAQAEMMKFRRKMVLIVFGYLILMIQTTS